MIDNIPAKLFGAIVGALLALVLHEPSGRREALRRLLASVVAGVIGSTAIIFYAGWPAVAEFIILAAMIAAYLAWPAMKASYKLIGPWIARKGES